MAKNVFGTLFYAIASCLVVVIAAEDSRAVDAPGVKWPNETKTATIGDLTLSIRISSRVAGAIDGLLWRGRQFVNDEDHGREIQGAAAFSDSHRECFNPTEAGAASDGVGPTTTSRLLALHVEPRRLTTEAEMAYWLNPLDTKRCGFANGAQNAPLSHDIFRKTVTIGAFGLPNVIQYESTFVTAEPRILGGFEAPTGYMPAEFSRFWIYNPINDRLQSVSGELTYQTDPIIFSTPDTMFAIGVYAPPQGQLIRYSGQRFTKPNMASPTVKWNVFFTIDSVEQGPHKFTSYLVVGSLNEVREILRTIVTR